MAGLLTCSTWASEVCLSIQQQAKLGNFQRILVGVVAVGAGLILIVAWAAFDSRRATWSEAAATSTNLTTTLAHEIGRTIQTYDLSLQAALRAINAPAFKTMDALSRHQLLFDSAVEARHMGSIFVMDSNGAIVNDSAAITPRQVSVGDREYFLAHKTGIASGLFISHPYQSRLAHDWSIALSRRVDGPDGHFAGIVVGAIRYSYFNDLFAKLDLGRGAGISLFDSDGGMLYPAPPNQQEASQPALVERLRAGQTQPFQGVADRTGERTLSTIARIDDLPIFLVMTTTLEPIYAAWTFNTRLAGGVAIVLLLTAWLLLRVLRRQQQALRQAEHREHELAEQARRESERHHASKIEAVGRLTAGVAHAFNNYLQTITSSLEIITADYLHEPDAKEIAQIAHKAATKGAKLTHRLLAFSRQQVLQPQRVCVAFLLADIRKLIADSRILDAEIRCKIAVEPFTDDLFVDQTQAESCLLNLLLNARDAMPQGGTLHL